MPFIPAGQLAQHGLHPTPWRPAFLPRSPGSLSKLPARLSSFHHLSFSLIHSLLLPNALNPSSFADCSCNGKRLRSCLCPFTNAVVVDRKFRGGREGAGLICSELGSCPWVLLLYKQGMDRDIPEQVPAPHPLLHLSHQRSASHQHKEPQRSSHQGVTSQISRCCLFAFFRAIPLAPDILGYSHSFITFSAKQ